MVDYTKPYPCGECGKMVSVDERHTYDDCVRFKNKIPQPIRGVIVRPEDFPSELMFPEGIDTEWIAWDDIKDRFK